MDDVKKDTSFAHLFCINNIIETSTRKAFRIAVIVRGDIMMDLIYEYLM